MYLSEDQYRTQFEQDLKDGISSIHREALERAWKNRDFEIELYWKRATYFWGFIAASFAGYFLIVKANIEFFQAEYIIICLGFIFSLAWYFVNIGSKKWQENWEKHIDMLEDKITGPIYKTVLDKPSYSVSKVNIIVSLFVTILWIILGINYWSIHVNFRGSFKDIDVIVLLLTSLTIIFFIILRYNKTSSRNNSGKNEEGKETFSFSKREFEYINPKEKK